MSGYDVDSVYTLYNIWEVQERINKQHGRTAAVSCVAGAISSGAATVVAFSAAAPAVGAVFGAGAGASLEAVAGGSATLLMSVALKGLDSGAQRRGLLKPPPPTGWGSKIGIAVRVGHCLWPAFAKMARACAAKEAAGGRGGGGGGGAPADGGGGGGGGAATVRDVAALLVAVAVAYQLGALCTRVLEPAGAQAAPRREGGGAPAVVFGGGSGRPGRGGGGGGAGGGGGGGGGAAARSPCAGGLLAGAVFAVGVITGMIAYRRPA
ncbi:MAG: hypothetical protein J3K34DRAFT_493250 [Monoraphidium minutum]|nr:MAG: hypothetical protein J3K34DRAFT_493250 [Monoraphidium minutum]